MRVHWLQHVPFEGLGSIGPWLRERGAQVSATRLYAGEALPDMETLDLVVAMGGPMSVNDDARYSWLAAECRFIREAIERGASVLGVCLGAQLIARALGARVYANAEREVGWWPVSGLSVESAAPGWARAGATNAVFHWHGETFDLPDGAVPLASSAGCANQAFQVGRRVIGIQFHLETTPDLVRALVAHCPDDLAPGAFVQSDDELRSVGDGAYTALNGLMANTLEYLCEPMTGRGGDEGRE